MVIGRMRRTVIFWIEEGLVVLQLECFLGRLCSPSFLYGWGRVTLDFHRIRRWGGHIWGTAAKHSHSLGYAAEIERLGDWIRDC